MELSGRLIGLDWWLGLSESNLRNILILQIIFFPDDKGENSRASVDSSATSSTSNIKTKKLFVTGLSFYTSEKTLCSAFEGFSEIVEVQIIMDKISKRSKGYAFVEYTTEEAASTALRDMNGKIINGWMITVDVAKKNPPKYSRVQARPTTS